MVCEIINQGIDSHLEAVFWNEKGIKDSKRWIEITDSASMRCFLRRLVEGDENMRDFASGIMHTLGYEWV